MHLHFHLSTGFLLNHGLNQGKMMPWVLFFSILPDFPYMLNFVYNGFRKKWRGMSRDDVVGWGFTKPAASWTHSLVGFGMVFLLIGLFAPQLTKVLLIGYLSHLALDYPFHFPYPYQPFYPLSQFKLRLKLSYFDPAHHSAQVNFAVSMLTLIGFCLLLL